MRTNNRVVAFLVRDEKGLCAVGKSSVTFEDLLNMFELWNQEDPVEYEKFRVKIMAAFDIAGRDLDQEARNG